MENKEPTLSQSHSGTGHNIARDMNVYNFGKHDFVTDLAIAIMIGSWDESKSDDISFIEYVTNEKYSEWILKIRQIESCNNSPLQHDSGRWVTINRLVTWHEVASRLFKDHLDRFKEEAVRILSSLDPKFDLMPEERYAAAIYGKVHSHSTLIRKGIAEGLALMSTAKGSLTNCADGYGEFIAGSVVKEVFDSGNWVLWASTKDIQPIMAEASPDDFLDAVEAAVIHLDKPFNTLFSQEGVGGITGTNYLTGLLWALETLSWSPVYLTRCIVLLGEMDSHDPGGNWANRPSNSIIDILLPWFPHTTANFEKRIASIKALEREFPETAWKVLLKLLPTDHGITSGTSKPKWRSFIPDNFTKEVSREDYIKQVVEYGDYVVGLSSKDVSRLPELVKHLDRLHEDAFNASIELFYNYSESDASSLEKYDLWIELLNFVIKHKKFSDADWSLADDKLDMLMPALSNLQPTEKELLYQRLFANNSMDLYEEKGNWREQEQAINEARKKAITELFDEGSYELVYEFASTVKSASLVGSLLAEIVTEDNENLLSELLISDDENANQFLSGYVWSRNHLTKGAFVENLNMDQWQVDDVANFLLLLPFCPNTWDVVEALLGTDFEHLYWKYVHVNAYQCDDEEGLYRGVDMLLKHGRPLSSTHCLYRLFHSNKTLKIEPTVRALLETLNTKEDQLNLDAHEIGELIQYIQGCDLVTDEELLRIEWAYLPLISSKRIEHGAPKYLEGKLASDPEFFCEIVSLAYKSDKEDQEVVLSEAQKNVAKNAYSLLDGWKVIPGTLEDGNFDSKAFSSWFEEVSKISRESGHSYSILRVIGKVLINAPGSADGGWIEQKIAEFLNQRDLEEVRKAYKMAIYNSRGAHWVDPEAKPEIELSEKYLARSEYIDLLGLQRFSRTLREIAENYAFEAESIIKRYSQSSRIPSDM